MKRIFVAILLLVCFGACKKQVEEVNLTTISEYSPLAVGKYITYNLDSLVFTNFGTQEAHRLYQVKYVVTDSLLDNIGRKAFRVVRFIRSSAANPFLPDNTFMALNTGNSFEFVENNYRYIKLVQPIEDDYTWKGNSYIDATSSNALNYLEGWDYTYEKVAQQPSAPLDTLNLGKNTITVNQIDYSFGLPVNLTTTYATRDFSKEVYAKGIGLVYRKFIHYVYQGNVSTGIRTYDGGGVTLRMIDHN
jgi:hypothetical protein